MISLTKTLNNFRVSPSLFIFRFCFEFVRWDWYCRICLATCVVSLPVGTDEIRLVDCLVFVLPVYFSPYHPSILLNLEKNFIFDGFYNSSKTKRVIKIIKPLYIDFNAQEDDFNRNGLNVRQSKSQVRR